MAWERPNRLGDGSRTISSCRPAGLIQSTDQMLDRASERGGVDRQPKAGQTQKPAICSGNGSTVVGCGVDVRYTDISTYF